MSAADSRTVPFFNYPHVFVSAEAELSAIIQDIGRRGAFILQRELEEFEAQLAAYCGARHAIGVANGTDALILALRAAGIGKGDEVIFSSHTYVATAGAIHYADAVPVPIECGSDHMLDPEAIEAVVTPRTRAIMPTQLNGRTCDMAAIGAVAEAHGLLVIEDAAQGLGSEFKGKMAGTFGAAGTISFYPAKTLGCLGDGGAVITNSDGLNEEVRLLRDHGRNADGEFVSWGLNSRLDNLQAAILLQKLRVFPEEVRRRREIARVYRDDLHEIPGVVLPPGPDDDDDHFDVYQNYEAEFPDRDQLQSFLREHGIGAVVQWGGKPVHQLTALGFDQSLPFTDQVFQRCMMLPMNTSLVDEDIAYVCSKIREFYSR
jgi:dTDP-4-amino-4,6-dideoxygalactose transaminase